MKRHGPAVGERYFQVGSSRNKKTRASKAKACDQEHAYTTALAKGREGGEEKRRDHEICVRGTNSKISELCLRT